MVAWSPTPRYASGIVPLGRGARLPGSSLTLTVKLWVAKSPSGSVAVTVMVAVPSTPAVTERASPETEAAATEASDEDASKVSSSPSGSVK